MPFFGNQDTRDILQIIKETTNNEELTVTIKNKEGDLVVRKSTLGGWIDYVREVGGRYLLKFSKDGIIEIKTSENDTAKTYIPRKKTEKYSEEELKNIKDKVAEIKVLIPRHEFFVKQ